MSKRDSFTIRKKILSSLKESSLSFAQLERRINTNSQTIKDSCNELNYYGLVDIVEKIHPSNGRKYYEVSITENGRKAINKSPPISLKTLKNNQNDRNG